MPIIDVNSQTDDGWTALHCAAANRHQSSVEFLLKNKADGNICNNEKIRFFFLYDTSSSCCTKWLI
ncbi:hypothetical protein TRFO_03299 [Tritrichomonas foetus]|uniref:Uncharacterized protein n=1 Tax=Tritrichomonas foetus TaxID=1144522 RepID=A0A1J4KQH1_9EUKA|nr:hypothetical protein TRFO_03299 [Tritrichomonas foetus]|eukprot:OHT13553.1 hypothetical protein TRFO_03299 [Tritrichomonas foetus]